MSRDNDQDSRAYYLAAIAVAAHEFGITLRELSLGGVDNLYEGAQLEPLGDWCDVNGELSFAEHNLIEEYLTSLVAGAVGKLIRLESRLPQFSRAHSGARLEWRSLSETLECQTRETDLVFALAFAHLKRVDGGDPVAAIYRLWQRARKLLYGPPRREQVIRLARRLQKVHHMDGDSVRQFLETLTNN